MSTFFERMDPKLQPVSPEGEVDPGPFLQAAKYVPSFIEMLGTAFSPVKKDVNGNITTLQQKFDTNPAKYQGSFRVMLEEEIAAGTSKSKRGSACVSLLWLKRGLEFICSLLKQIVEDHQSGARSENLGPICKKAYEDTLKRYHGWMVQKIFSLAAKALPYRRDFMKTLAYGDENLNNEVVEHMDSFVQLLEPNVMAIDSLLDELNLQSNEKV